MLVVGKISLWPFMKNRVITKGSFADVVLMMMMMNMVVAVGGVRSESGTLLTCLEVAKGSELLAH